MPECSILFSNYFYYVKMGRKEERCLNMSIKQTLIDGQFFAILKIGKNGSDTK